MPRNKIVPIGEKKINVQERRVGELEELTKQLFPSTKGKLKNLDKALNDLELDWDLLYDKIPVVFPEVTKEDVVNAYPSELENLIGAFIDVNFFALKQMIPKLMLLAQTGSQRK